ncbi:MAG: hypothetical protein HQK98_03150 [Nitrospirae bacterium]|nr:hypothetical protein [Nitrospirota bacterium]
MEKDFHYDIIYSIARLTECANPEIIAHASQFVDDNSERWFGEDVPFPEKIPYSTGGHYFPIMTQSMSVLSVDPYIQKFVYIPFHFLPGNNNVTIQGKKNPLSTTPGSINAIQLLQKALASNDPYRIGIALHTFADTWSHQNFTGMEEDWNAVYPWYDISKNLAPHIGHANAGHSPDVISEIWTDHRLAVEDRQVDNKTRALEAILLIYLTLNKHTGKGPGLDKVKDDYTKIVGAADFNSRIATVASLIRDKFGEEVPSYDSNVWTSAVLKEKGFVVKKSFEFRDEVALKTSDWYKFNQAAKAQLAFVLSLIEDL